MEKTCESSFFTGTLIVTKSRRAAGVGGGYNITTGFNSWTNEACK